jgi:protein-disulfide isomerase
MNMIVVFEDQATKQCAALDEKDVPRLGTPGARNTLVVFSDFQCPYCKAATELVEKELLPGAKAQLVVVFRQLPLRIPSHSWSRPAAEATACVYRQNADAFWAVHDYLFQHQDEITAETLDAELKAQLKHLAPTVNEQEYSDCLAKGLGAAIVSRDAATASRLQVSGTPTFFLNGRRIDGLPPIDQFWALLSDTSAP